MIDLLWNAHTSTSIFCPLKCWLSLYILSMDLLLMAELRETRPRFKSMTNNLNPIGCIWNPSSISRSTRSSSRSSRSNKKTLFCKNIHNEGITQQRHFQTHRFYCFHLVRLPTEWITEKIPRHNERGIHSMHTHHSCSWS